MEQISTSPLKGESAKAYKAFRLYLNLGEKRTQKNVAKKQKLKRSQIGAWAVKFKWTERVITWLSEQAQLERAAEEKAALETARERMKRQEEVQNGAYNLYLLLRNKVHDMLKFPVARQTVTKDEKGKSITTIIEPMRWNFGDVARVAAMADSLARLSLGMATSNGKITVGDPNGAPLPAPVQTLIQVNISRAKDAETNHDYKLLKGEEDEEENTSAINL